MLVLLEMCVPVELVMECPECVMIITSVLEIIKELILVILLLEPVSLLPIPILAMMEILVLLEMFAAMECAVE